MEQNRVKKLIALGVAGCLVLGTTVVALATETSGYEAYKDAVKATAFNSTSDDNANMLVKLVDNGEILVTGSIESDSKDDAYFSKIKLNVRGQESTITTKYTGDETTITCNGEEMVLECDDIDADAEATITYEEPEPMDPNSNSIRLAEMVADTLVGDTKSHFVKSGDTVSLSLEGAQIPELAKLAAATAIEQFATNDVDEYRADEVYPGDDEMQAAYDCIPQLKNIEVSKIVMNADITDGVLNENDFTIVYSGKDASGVNHEVEVYVAVLI